MPRSSRVVTATTRHLLMNQRRSLDARRRRIEAHRATDGNLHRMTPSAPPEDATVGA